MIAEATKSEILWSDDFSEENAEHTGMLYQVVTKGRVSVCDATIDATMEDFQYEQMRAGLDGSSHGFALQFLEPPPFATVFGQSVDLGDYRVFLRPKQVEAFPIPDSLMQVRMIGEVTFVFSRFALS
jgi:hypothetical protein